MPKKDPNAYDDDGERDQEDAEETKSGTGAGPEAGGAGEAQEAQSLGAWFHGKQAAASVAPAAPGVEIKESNEI